MGSSSDLITIVVMTLFLCVFKDLDNETLMHIDAENRRQTLEEELEFLKGVHDQVGLARHSLTCPTHLLLLHRVTPKRLSLKSPVAHDRGFFLVN